MKAKVIIILLICISVKTYAQTKNSLTVTYGWAINALIRNENLVGDASYRGAGSNAYGIRYSINLNHSFYIETGLEYSLNGIRIAPSTNAGIDQTPVKYSVNLVSFPVYSNYTFLKFCFVNAGVIIYFETNKSENESAGIDNQSGIGFGLGFGGKYTFKKITISTGLFSQAHAILPFKKSNYQQRLMKFGENFGVGYNF